MEVWRNGTKEVDVNNRMTRKANLIVFIYVFKIMKEINQRPSLAMVMKIRFWGKINPVI